MAPICSFSKTYCWPPQSLFGKGICRIFISIFPTLPEWMMTLYSVQTGCMSVWYAIWPTSVPTIRDQQISLPQCIMGVLRLPSVPRTHPHCMVKWRIMQIFLKFCSILILEARCTMVIPYCHSSMILALGLQMSNRIPLYLWRCYMRPLLIAQRIFTYNITKSILKAARTRHGIVPAHKNDIYRSILEATKVINNFPRNDIPDHRCAMLQLKPGFSGNKDKFSFGWVHGSSPPLSPPASVAMKDVKRKGGKQEGQRNESAQTRAHQSGLMMGCLRTSDISNRSSYLAMKWCILDAQNYSRPSIEHIDNLHSMVYCCCGRYFVLEYQHADSDSTYGLGLGPQILYVRILTVMYIRIYFILPN